MTEISGSYPHWQHKNYKLQICDKTTGSVKRTVYPRRPEYIYTQSQNKKDFGTPAREFRVKVWSVDINDILSSSPAVLDCRKTEVDFSNAAPILTADYNGIDVDLTSLALNDDDLEQMMIYSGNTSPPTNLKAIVSAQTKHKFLRFTPSQPTTKYIQVVPVDKYGAGIASQVASILIDPTTLIPVLAPLDIVIVGDGGHATDVSPNPRIEYRKSKLVGYSDATTEEFKLSAASGKAFSVQMNVSWIPPGLLLWLHPHQQIAIGLSGDQGP